MTLRTYGMVEDKLNVTTRHADIVTVQAEIEDITDQEFLQPWAATHRWGTPLYFKDAVHERLLGQAARA
jgi:hypothetical protein